MTGYGNTSPLGEYLRARRALVRPESHGISSGQRRTPGLRREEVAVLAGVSTDYYIRLEQGREKHPSHQVVDALAAALLLEDEAATYLRGLAHPLAEALFSWLDGETNLLRAMFRPAARAFYQEWDRIAEGCVAALRTQDIDPADPRLTDLVEELARSSPDFARLWARQDVRPKTAEVKHLHHAVVGHLSLRFENLTVADTPGQHLVVYHAEPGSPEERALDRLAELAASAID